MNYQKIYDSIIDRARLRGLNKKLLNYYTEKHHIIPRCMNGTNDKSNLVLLTGREHYLCHWLLWKTNKENKSLIRAYFSMISVNKHNFIPVVSSLQYELIRSKFSNAMKEFKIGTSLSDETKLKMSVAHKNRCYPYWSLNRKPWNYGLKCEYASIANIGNKNAKGCKRSDEQKIKYSESKLGDKNPMYGKVPWNKGKTKAEVAK